MPAGEGQTDWRRERPSLRTSWMTPAGSISPSQAAHGRWPADSAGAWQSADRGGGGGTPHAGAARATHPAAQPTPR